jgi:hypothetical protein
MEDESARFSEADMPVRRSQNRLRCTSGIDERALSGQLQFENGCSMVWNEYHRVT